MASHTFCSGPLPGTQLRTVQTGERRRRLKSILTVAGVSKKVTTYDDKWSKVRLVHCFSDHHYSMLPCRHQSPKKPPSSLHSGHRPVLRGRHKHLLL